MTGGRHADRTLFLCVVCVATALTAGCVQEVEVDESLVRARASSLDSLVERSIGEPLPGDQVLAVVGEREITVQMLALYLELLPGLSVEQALEDLVDAVVIEASLQESPEAESWRREGGWRGAAHAWIRAVTWLALEDIDLEAAVSELIASPEFAGRAGVVPMARVSHVLVQSGETEHAEVHSILEEMVGRVNQTAHPVTRQDMSEAIDQWREDPRLEGVDMRIEGPFTVVQDNRMIGTRVSAVPVVPEFAEAAFLQHEGVLGRPVVTRFGTHLIVVHRFEQGEMAAEASRRELARRMVVARAQDAALGSRVERLRRQASVVVDQEVVELLSVSPTERLRFEREDFVQGGR